VGNAAALAPKTCVRCGGTFGADAAFCPRDGTKLGDGTEELAPDTDPYIGTVISGDIEIRSIAGAGAMGRVYRAHQRGIDRDVAVKILHRELSGNAHLVQRFHREAKIASKLQHPHVVEVYLAGQLPDGALYIVMEYLDGLSLAAAIHAAGGVIAIERALSIALQICDAVGEGHARGIVHRDLKPENVMLVRRADLVDWVKVLDFGIAKVSLGEQSMQTAAGLIFGTARYISPEGAQGAAVGPAGDVYSLAVIVYQLLTGRTPFDAEQPVGLLVKHIHETPPPLTSWPLARDVPAGIARIVMENLAKDPTRRAANGRAFASALAAAAKDANISLVDGGVVARLATQDAVARSRAPSALDPTLDDAAGVAALSPLPVVSSAPPAANVIVTSAPPPQPTSLSSASAAALDESEIRARRDPSPESRRERRSTSAVVIVLAFLLGAALAVLATREVMHRGGSDEAKYVARARRALVEGRYVSPPNDNVRDLVDTGLQQWPDDPELNQMKSDAAHELVTQAMAARAGGDVGGARQLAHEASQLDPSDQSARILLAQYDQELGALTSGASTNVGPPRLLFDVPLLARKGDRVPIRGRIVMGAAGAKAKVEGLRVALLPNRKTSGGTPIPMQSSDPARLEGTLVAPAPGSYDVVLEASVDGTFVRALRDLDVLP